MQDRWADNTGTDVRQSGGIDSKPYWAPQMLDEEERLQGLRKNPGPPSDMEIHAPDCDG